MATLIEEDDYDEDDDNDDDLHEYDSDDDNDSDYEEDDEEEYLNQKSGETYSIVAYECRSVCCWIPITKSHIKPSFNPMKYLKIFFTDADNHAIDLIAVPK